MKKLFIITLLLAILLSSTKKVYAVYDSDIGYTEEERERNSILHTVSADGSEQVSFTLTSNVSIMEYYNNSDNNDIRTLIKDMSLKAGSPYGVVQILLNANRSSIGVTILVTPLNTQSEQSIYVFFKNLCETEFFSQLNDYDKQLFKDAFIESNLLSESVIAEDLFSFLNPDIGGGYRLYRPFQGFIGTFLAVATVAIIVFIIASYGTDIVFIVLNNLFSTENPKGVSKYAKEAVRERYTEDKFILYVLGKYFIKRYIGLCILFICILYLFQGEITDLIMKVLVLFEN